MKNLNLTSTYKYKRENGTTIVGYVVGGTLDGGDYGVSETIDMLLPNEETVCSVPVSKLIEITREEYCERCELMYGMEMV